MGLWQKLLAPSSSKMLAAACQGDFGTFTALLKRKPSLVSSRDNKGYTPLHKAAGNGRKDVAELLLASGADPNAKARDHRTVLDLATVNRHKEVAALLRQHGGCQSSDVLT